MKNKNSIFKDLKEIKIIQYSLCDCFEDKEKNELILEPAVISQLESIKKLMSKEFSKIVEEIQNRMKKSKKIYMPSDFEKPFYDIKDCVYVELVDVLNALHIYIEDKSRPSDYGD